MAVLIGSAIIAAAILLSTLVPAVGTRFVGIESPADDNVWLIDRLTGSVYRCKAPERGKASCCPEVATGGIRGAAEALTPDEFPALEARESGYIAGDVARR